MTLREKLNELVSEAVECLAHHGAWELCESYDCRTVLEIACQLTRAVELLERSQGFLDGKMEPREGDSNHAITRDIRAFLAGEETDVETES